MLRAQRTARKEEDKTSFSLRHNAESFVVSSVRLVGTTWENCQRFITNVFLKTSSGRRGLERFHDWTWGCRDCCFLRWHGSQRVAWEEKYQVPSSSLWGVVFARPYLRLFLSSSVSVFVCPCLRLSLSSSASVFVFLCRSVRCLFRGRRLSIRCSISRVWKPPWRACFKFVKYSVKCGELVVKRPLLCCDAFQ